MTTPEPAASRQAPRGGQGNLGAARRFLETRWLRRLALGLVLMAAASGAQALCVLCTCTVTITNIVFPPYNPLSSGNADSVGNVRLKFGGAISLAVPYSVAISKGSGTGFLTRTLKNGAAALSYNLFPTNALAAIWGDGTGGSALFESTVNFDLFGSSPTIDLPVYARIPGGQHTVAPGGYSDSITVTVTYY